MIVKRYDSREDWENDRLGRITGSKVKDVITKRGNGKKVGFYQLIADRLALPHDGENVMDRGTRLEEEALALFAKETHKRVDKSLVMWFRDDNESIAISPDGIISDTEAVEVKCLSSARHIEALVTQEVPDEFQDQTHQYFIVNDKLQILYMAFYDPRLTTKQFFYLTIQRDQVVVETFLEMERELLKEVDEVVGSLMEF